VKHPRTVSAQYSVAEAGSVADRVAARMRRRMYERFLVATDIRREDRILDVGVTSDDELEASNYLEAWYPHKNQLTACGIDEGAAHLEKKYPGIRYVRADGKALPFQSNEFDVVHSSAVIEHVGSLGDQARFVSELTRVAKRAVFITTPNRWFPVEFHSAIPLIHWLPAPRFRALLRFIGHEALAKEENLNLLSRGDLCTVCRTLNLDDFDLSGVRLCGWTSNLLLCIRGCAQRV